MVEWGWEWGFRKNRHPRINIRELKNQDGNGNEDVSKQKVGLMSKTIALAARAFSLPSSANHREL